MYYAIQDVVDHLISFSGGGAQDAEQRDLRAAVHHAYRDLINAKDWHWHTTQGRIMLQPAESVSGVTVGAGGTTLTRASGTWPTDAKNYRAYIDGVVAQVAVRTSGTVLTLSPTFKFPESFSGTKNVILYRNTYPLPSDFRNMDALVTQDRTSVTSYVNPTDWARIEGSVLLSGDPVYWTVMRDESSTVPDRWVVRVCGYPTSAETVDFTYRRKVDPPRYTGYETAARAGTLSCSASTSVIGVNTGFKPDMANCILRVIDSSVNHPEPLSGIYPFAEQSVISSVGSATTITLKDALSGTYVGHKYVISSGLDLSESMFSAVLAGAELWLARMRKGNVGAAGEIYMRDLRMAMEADVMSPISGRRSAVYGNPEISYSTAVKMATIAPDNG